MSAGALKPIDPDARNDADDGTWTKAGLLVFLFVAAAGVMWAVMVMSIIKMAYDGLIALMQWQTWLFR